MILEYINTLKNTEQNMVVEPPPSLSYLGGILGTAIGGEIPLDQLQSNYVIQNLKRYNMQFSAILNF